MRWVIRVALWLMLVPLVGWVALRGFGWDRYAGLDALVPILAYTPYVGMAAIVPVSLALVTRKWVEFGAAVVVLVVFAGMLVPRLIPDSAAAGSAAGSESGSAGGAVPLRVMSANMLVGGGSARRLVDVVRAERPDVLSVQELTPAARDRLAAAGIDRLMPYKVLNVAPSASGTGLYARHPISAGDRQVFKGSPFSIVSGRVRKSAVEVEVFAVHTAPPVPALVDGWRSDFGRLRTLTTTGSANGPIRVLAGDFNATLDHQPLRALLDGGGSGPGFRDAADAAGAGFTPTWPSRWYESRLPLAFVPVSIDHVLVSGSTDVSGFRAYDLPGSDHRMVAADLMLPASR